MRLDARLPTRTDSDWWNYASCKGFDVDLFFPQHDGTPGTAIQILCRDCPVRPDCLQEAIDTDADGYWGGMTKRARRALYSGRPRVKCPACHNRKTKELADLKVCNLCGTSW